MAKHKYIETPEAMWDLFTNYVNDTKNNPRKKHTFVGKDGTSEFELLERPLTFEGFYCHCYDAIGCIDQYFENRGERYSEYVAICSRIKRTIREDQISGGMVGQYNPSITQRLNNLTERVDTTTKGESISEIKVNIITSNKGE
jgi:hypothetical protein